MTTKMCIGQPATDIARQFIVDHYKSSGHPETRIVFTDDSTAFYNWSGALSRETIANEESIGWNEYTVAWKRQPKSVDIGNTVTSIGSSVFSNCDALTSVTIPDSVMSIGESAFAGCIALTSVMIGNGVKSIGNLAFITCSILTSITIPNSVTSIGSGAFWDCRGLTSVAIPDSVTSIEAEAFGGCIGLTSVMIGNGVTGIGDGVFMNCNDLTSVTIDKTKAQVEAMEYSDWGLGIGYDENWNTITFQVTIHCNDNQDIVINPQS